MAGFDIAYVAKLARLRLTSEEAERFQTQIEHVLEYADKLREVDVSGVEPAAHPVPMLDVTRTDEARDWFAVEDALANAPRTANGRFIVPKVVE